MIGLETAQLLASVQRVQGVLNHELEHIESITRDYATRDESFNFVTGHDPGDA